MFPRMTCDDSAETWLPLGDFVVEGLLRGRCGRARASVTIFGPGHCLRRSGRSALPSGCVWAAMAEECPPQEARGEELSPPPLARRSGRATAPAPVVIVGDPRAVPRREMCRAGQAAHSVAPRERRPHCHRVGANWKPRGGVGLRALAVRISVNLRSVWLRQEERARTRSSMA